MTDPAPRLGAIDTCALYALKSILASLERDDGFDDLLEEYLIETNSHAAGLVDIEDDDTLDEEAKAKAMDEYYRLLDRYRDKVLRRTGQALADLFRPPPPVLPGHLASEYVPRPAHPVARAYEAWLTEQSAQT